MAQVTCSSGFHLCLMMDKRLFPCLIVLSVGLSTTGIEAQKSSLLVFYNTENLFDTLADPQTLDQARTPSGLYHWNRERFQRKLEQLSELLVQLENKSKDGPSLIGLCEIENAGVLRDLLRTKPLSTQEYGWIHHDSPDRRGIDLALLYRKKEFLPLHYNAHRLLLENEKGYRVFTRDQLVITGILQEEEITLLLVHWPSRRGGKSRSSPLRKKAAELSLRILDSLRTENPERKIIVMGDFNDNPHDASLELLQKKWDSLSALINPMEELYQKGMGTVAYRDEWALFDQFLFSKSLIATQTGWSAQHAFIYCLPSLINSKGRYKGYPYRTYVGTVYQGGYSDHLPVGIRLQWRKKTTESLVLREPKLPGNPTKN